LTISVAKEEFVNIVITFQGEELVNLLDKYRTMWAVTSPSPSKSPAAETNDVGEQGPDVTDRDVRPEAIITYCQIGAPVPVWENHYSRGTAEARRESLMAVTGAVWTTHFGRITEKVLGRQATLAEFDAAARQWETICSSLTVGREDITALLPQQTPEPGPSSISVTMKNSDDSDRKE
jgi:hypothetical protein